MSLLRLPNDLIFEIARYFKYKSDINALHKTARRLYYPLDDYLYQHNRRYHGSSALVWAIRENSVPTARKARGAGVSADEALDNMTFFPEWARPPVLAMEHENEQIIRLLLERDLDLSKCSYSVCRLYPHLASACLKGPRRPFNYFT